MEKLRDQIYHEIKLVNGIAFLKIAERAVKEYKDPKNKGRYGLDDLNALAREAAEREDLFILDTHYSDRYNKLRCVLGEIIQAEEKKTQELARFQSNPRLLTKIAKKVIPLKPGFKGVAI